MYADDTIAAIATPPGPGGIGIIRVSGGGAESIANRVFARRGTKPWETHRLYHGQVLDVEGTPLDDGMAVLMRAPRSYTGEDVLELHCHGSAVVLRRVLDTILSLGARSAVAGEFSQRAFLNGKLDLAQVEAVLALVQARTPESAAQAADQLFGHLSRHLDALRERLIRIKAHLEVQIDFADEATDQDEADITQAVESIRQDIESLLRTYERGKLLREGVRVVIVGRPNVGKSSLLNALLGEERAIVAPSPGTTRDVIEEHADFGGVQVVISDTAGLREDPDHIERLGIDRARRVAQTADVLLVVFDGSIPPGPMPDLFDVDRAVVILNKIDLPSAWDQAAVRAVADRWPVVCTSAKEGRGLDEVRRAVVDAVGSLSSDGLPALISARQRAALSAALECLNDALAGVRRMLPADLIAVDVQGALDHIGAVTGAITSEDVLDRIFSEFCIGK